MKKFLSVLLSIIFAIVLLVTLMFNIVRVNVTPSKIMDLGASMINSMALAPSYDDGLFHPDQKVLSNAGYDIGGMDIDFDLNNLDIGEIVQQLVKANGYDFKVDEELIADILSDSETKDLVDSVMNQAVDYMAGKTETIELNPDKIESVVVKSIKKIEDKTGEKIEYDSAELKAEIAAGVEEALPSVTEALDEVKEENGADLEMALKVLDFFSIKYLFILIGILIVLAALIFVLNMNVFTMFRYISIPVIIVGLILITAGTLRNVATSMIVEFLKNDFESLIAPVTVLVSTIFRQILMNGVCSLVPGIALCVVGFIKKTK